jgi:tryptophanyl-tRNA synthetase
MSKSYGNTIDIFAEGKALKNAVMGIKTDSTPVDQPKNPAACNAFAIYKLFADSQEQTKLAEFYRDPLKDADARGGRPFGYGDAKTMLLAKIDSFFAPAREKRKQLASQPEYVEGVLKEGARKARAEARQTMALVRQAVGMLPRPVGDPT